MIMVNFTLSHLDHVAVYSSDPEASVAWYESALGLNRLQLKEWGAFPIFMLAGKVGIAIFKADPEAQPPKASRGSVRIDHFAFNLSPNDFALAQAHYEALGLRFHFQDHHYFHSIYTKDPDGHTVELTTLVKPILDSDEL